MDFKGITPIYLQIADALCEDILTERLRPDEKIPSVREYGAEIGVNPNTVMRTYDLLADGGIIESRRGIGYFTTPDAREKVLERRRKEFMDNTLPRIKKELRLLRIDPGIFKDTDHAD